MIGWAAPRGARLVHRWAIQARVLAALGRGDAESAYHLAAILWFDSLAAIQSALGSPEGQATAGDLANFAQAGVDLLMFDSKEV